MIRLTLIEGTPPEAEWSECLEDYGVYGETMDGTPFVVATDRVEVALRDGSRIRTRMRPLPPGTIITITVRDAAPHDVQIVKPGPAVYWMEWCEVKPGQVVVSKDGDWYRKNQLGLGCGADVNHEYSRENMRRSLYRRPFDPWHLVPAEESEVET